MQDTTNSIQSIEESYVKYHDLELEQTILNIILLDNNLLPNISDSITETDFSYEINQKIFTAMKTMYEEKAPIDIMTLNSHVDFQEPAYIASLSDKTFTATNWEYYVKQLLDITALRKAYILTTTVFADLTVQNIRDRIDQAAKEILDISIDSNSFKIKQPSEMVPALLNEMAEAVQNPKILSGYSWGLTELDKITGGIQNEFIIVGARPSKGKTAFCLKAIDTCCKAGIKVGLFTLETTSGMILNRLISMNSHVQTKNMKSGVMSVNQQEKVFYAAEKINDWPLYIMDDVYYQEDIKAKIRYMVRGLGMQVVFIDYFSKIRTRKNYGQRHEMFADISSDMANLRKELNTPIVMLSQLRRDAESKKPILADLGETKSLEQDGDLIFFIEQDRGGSNSVNKAELIIAKAKDGPVGIVNVGFRKEFTEFVNLENEEVVKESKPIKKAGFYNSVINKEKVNNG